MKFPGRSCEARARLIRLRGLKLQHSWDAKNGAVGRKGWVFPVRKRHWKPSFSQPLPCHANNNKHYLMCCAEFPPPSPPLPSSLHCHTCVRSDRPPISPRLPPRLLPRRRNVYVNQFGIVIRFRRLQTGLFRLGGTRINRHEARKMTGNRTTPAG